MLNQTQNKTRSQIVFEWACTLYILSLLIVLPFMTWKDTVYVIAIALIGYGLGKWKGKAYEVHILPFAVAFLAAKPFLHYGPYPTDWSWQRYAILGETALLGIIFLVARVQMGLRVWQETRQGCEAIVQSKDSDSIRFLSAGIILALSGVMGSCTVSFLLRESSYQQLFPLVLSAICLMVIYSTFVHRFSLDNCK